MTPVRWRRALVLALGCIAVAQAEVPEEDPYAERRSRMVRAIEVHATSARSALGRPTLDPRVLEVMGRVPRHEFVPRRLRKEAYSDRALPIGSGQTISQPFVVALMTDLLHVGADDVVLEVGTGSGYQAAVLAHLVRRVYSIEILPDLKRTAAERLERLGYENVVTRLGDGYQGWKEHAPFDGILVTAAAESVPPPLIRQLKPGGRMLIPVGRASATQQITLVQKDAEGQVTARALLPVVFVPLTREDP